MSMTMKFEVFMGLSGPNDIFGQKCSSGIELDASYDSQGLSVKFMEEIRPGEKIPIREILLQKSSECSRLLPCSYVITIEGKSVIIRFKNSDEMNQFHKLVNNVKNKNSSSVFSQRTDESSASQYFQFYGYLAQQQNMLQDYVRTSTYQKAFLINANDFQDKVVLDVGAGSGILSFFAIQAGAARVYAVEASTMAQNAETLVIANKYDDRIKVIAGKIEEIELPEKVDIVISEPMGYMLYNERMLETFLHAKKWLKKGGQMFPSKGDLHVAPFMDDALHMEQTNKANFWVQKSFHGVDLSSMHDAAIKEYFRQPVVDTFDIRICLSKSVKHSIDFLSTEETDLHNIHVPVEFLILEAGTVHGLAFWFDVAFNGSGSCIWLSTSPTEALTHWYQVRCLLENPIFVKAGQTLRGDVQLIANQRQSYDVLIDIHVEGVENGRSVNILDLKNPYFRYSGQPVAPPPGTNTTSPSEAYCNQLDAAQDARQVLNGLAVNGLAEVHAESLINQRVGGYMTQAMVHPGSIISTGRNNTIASPPPQPVTLTAAGQNNQLIIGGPHFPLSNNLIIGDYVSHGDNMMLPNNMM